MHISRSSITEQINPLSSSGRLLLKPLATPLLSKLPSTLRGPLETLLEILHLPNLPATLTWKWETIETTELIPSSGRWCIRRLSLYASNFQLCLQTKSLLPWIEAIMSCGAHISQLMQKSLKSLGCLNSLEPPEDMANALTLNTWHTKNELILDHR